MGSLQCYRLGMLEDTSDGYWFYIHHLCHKTPNLGWELVLISWDHIFLRYILVYKLVDFYSGMLLLCDPWTKFTFEYFCVSFSWRRQQMETFSTLLAICAGNWPVTGEFPSQRPARGSFDVFFDTCLNKQSSKQSEAGDLRQSHAHYDNTVMCLNNGIF